VSPPLSFIGQRLRLLASPASRVFKYALGHTGFRTIAAEFFVEVGVLWFVFPILDTIVQFGTSKVTVKLTIASIGVAMARLFLAGILSRSVVKEDRT
jgi:hypothetical protein